MYDESLVIWQEAVLIQFKAACRNVVVKTEESTSRVLNTGPPEHIFPAIDVVIRDNPHSPT